MICINHKKNPKLLETFNNDPYSDITIFTSSSQLHLVLGYLSIDSQFFDEVAPDARQINLQHLAESPLIKILRALYGQQLFAYNVNELSELYTSIQFLKINEYKENIVNYISTHPQLMDSFQLIQFCFTRDVLVNQIKQHHFKLKLTGLASTKNYLQLNKLSQNTLNTLLLEYSQIKGEQADSTINSIIQNYLGRNDLRPNEYFIQPGLEPLLMVWQKFHHSISYLITAQQKIRQSQMLHSEETKKSMMQTTAFGNHSFNYSVPNLMTSPSISMGNSPSTFNPGQTLKLNYQSSVHSNPGSFTSQLQERQNKIMELQTELLLKKQIIESLKIQIAHAKSQLMHKKVNRFVQSDEQLQDAKHIKKDLNITGGDYDVSMIEPAFNQARKIVNEQATEVKTMHKLNERTRKIFN